MTKADLIDKISQDNGLSKTTAQKVLSSVLEGITDALKNGETLSLVGFGTFSISKRAARKGRNPRTGAQIKIPAKNVVKFKAGKGLKELV